MAKPTILIAEDEITSRLVLTSSLEEMGYQTVSYANGAEAWAAFDKNPARIIVSDWMMPEMDGLELCRKVRAREDTEYAYFILLTSFSGKENHQRAIDAGIDDFLPKPLDPEAIWMRLRVAERIIEYTTRIKQLGSLLPICIYCHKIRNDDDYWQQLEKYLSIHTGVDFTHGLCPECYQKQMDAVEAQLRGR